MKRVGPSPSAKNGCAAYPRLNEAFQPNAFSVTSNHTYAVRTTRFATRTSSSWHICAERSRSVDYECVGSVGKLDRTNFEQALASVFERERLHEQAVAGCNVARAMEMPHLRRRRPVQSCL